MEAKTGLTYPISRARKALLYWKIPTLITVHVHNVYFQARKIRLSSQSVRLISCTVCQFHCFSFPLIFYSFPHLYQGLQITGKQRISAWELMEGYKNPSPLSWAWFGAVRIERKPLRYEQDFRRLLHHTHPRRRPLSYFLSPAPDKEDEQDEEEDRIELDAAAADKSSQPATPQTPADNKGETSTDIKWWRALGGVLKKSAKFTWK